jgi:hypothetical protein
MDGERARILRMTRLAVGQPVVIAAPRDPLVPANAQGSGPPSQAHRLTPRLLR